MANKSISNRQKIRYKTRNKLFGTPGRPRLCVFKSNQNTYCQIIDDINGVTLAAANTKSIDSGSKTEKASTIGKQIAEQASNKNIDSIVFDRSGYRYIGRVKALAEAAREGGLKF